MGGGICLANALIEFVHCIEYVEAPLNTEYQSHLAAEVASYQIQQQVNK